MRRRPTLAALGAACFGWTAVSRGAERAPKVLSAPEPVAQIAAGGPTGVLAVGVPGNLYALDAHGGRAKRLADGIDPDTPLAVGHGHIAARRQDGALWVLDTTGASGSKAGALAPAAGLLVLPRAIVGVAAEGQRYRVVRLEPAGPGTWSPVARSTVDVLPDARPLLADLDGAGDGGRVMVFAGPDAERYPHGVLGDAVEATRLCALERHSLDLKRDLALAPPYVYEDIAPRRVQQGTREGLLTVRSGPAGGQLLLIEADPAATASLRVAANGPALGTPNRWMSPTTDGHRWMAVHTPHIGGVLHEYRLDGNDLVATRVQGGVSNHVIGSRRLDLAAWVGPWLLVPDQRRRRLVMLDSRTVWKQGEAWSLPSRVVATARLMNAQEGVLILYEDGGVGLVRPLSG